MSVESYLTNHYSGGTFLISVPEIFQGDSLSSIIFVLCLAFLSLILKKAKAGYEFRISEEKINQLFYMDDLKPFSKNEKCIGSLIHTVRLIMKDIGMEFDIDKCAVLFMRNKQVVNIEGIQIFDD